MKKFLGWISGRDAELVYHTTYENGTCVCVYKSVRYPSRYIVLVWYEGFPSTSVVFVCQSMDDVGLVARGFRPSKGSYITNPDRLTEVRNWHRMCHDPTDEAGGLHAARADEHVSPGGGK